MDFEYYKNKAKSLGGNLRRKTYSIGTSVHVIAKDGTDVSSGSCYSKDFFEKYKEFFEIRNEMHEDKDFRKNYIC